MKKTVAIVTEGDKNRKNNFDNGNDNKSNSNDHKNQIKIFIKVKVHLTSITKIQTINNETKTINNKI